MQPLLVMHQSIPAVRRLPPARADPWALAIFFALDGKFPGGEDPRAANSPGWGWKKKVTAPYSVNTATFFIDCTVK